MTTRSTSFDTARRLDIYFRVARVGSKKFIFTYGTGSAVDISTFSFRLYIKRYEGDLENAILLTVGDGLTVGGSSNNELTAAVTVAQTSLPEGKYYWELYKGSTSKTYLTGIAFLHNGKFDGLPADASTNNLSIIEDGENVEIQIQDTSDHYRGLYPSLAALQTGVPVGNAGDYADVDGGPGTDVARYIWDVDDVQWVLNSGSASFATLSGSPSDNASLLASLNAKLNGLFTVKTKTDNHTFDSTDLTDAGTGKPILFLMDKASAVTFTYPLNSDIAIPVGTLIYVMWYGAGQTTLAAAVGVTFRNSSSTNDLQSRYSIVSMLKIGTNEVSVTNGVDFPSALAQIALLTPSDDDILQRKANAWTNRTLAQYRQDLAIISSIAVHADAAEVIVLTNMASAKQVFPNNSNNSALKFDTTNYRQARLTTRVSVAGATNSRLYIEYSSDGTTFTDLGTTTAGSADTIGLAATGHGKVTNWITLPAGGKGDLIWRVAQEGGDATADPEIRATAIQFRM